MAFMVVSGAGYGKVIVRFPTAKEALAEARDQIEHDGQNVLIRVSATGDEFTAEAFAAKIAGEQASG